MGKLYEIDQQAFGSSSICLHTRQILMAVIRCHEWLTQRWEQRKKTTASFSTFLTTSSRSRQAETLERNLLFALGARRGRCFHAANRFRDGNAEGNAKCLSSTRDDTNSQRPTQFQAFSDD